MLGLHCCVGFSPVAASGGHSVIALCGLLIAVASLFAERGPQGAQASVAAELGLSSWGSWALEHRLNTCGTQAKFLWGLWYLTQPEIKPMSPGRLILNQWDTREALYHFFCLQIIC